MSLNNLEEVETSLLHAQSTKIQIQKKKTMQKSNKSSTLQLAAYVKKMQQIIIYLAVNVTFIYIRDAGSYHHTNLTVLLKRNANAHVLIERQSLVHLLSDRLDMQVNETKEHLVEIKTVKHLSKKGKSAFKGKIFRKII